MVLRGARVRGHDLIRCVSFDTHSPSLLEHHATRIHPVTAFEVVALGIRQRRNTWAIAHKPIHFRQRPIRNRHHKDSLHLLQVFRTSSHINHEDFSLMDTPLDLLCKGTRAKRLAMRLPREALPDGRRRVSWNAITTSTIS
jgi:hypothetical protein